MTNTLELRELPSSTVKRHGGKTQTQRRHEIRINGVVVRDFCEGSQQDGYQTGVAYNALIEGQAARFAKALKCEVTRTSVSHVDNGLKIKIFDLLFPDPLDVEWSAVVHDRKACPVCRGYESNWADVIKGHQPGCELERLIRPRVNGGQG